MSYSNIAEAFEIFAKIADAQGEQYRAFAYRRAIISPSNVGADLAQKIQEFETTGHIRQLDEYLQKPEIHAFIEFDKILGFGPKTIRNLISQGIMTRLQLIDAIQRQKIILTTIQNIGLRFFDDLQKKIPRDHVARISEIIFTEIFKTSTELFDSLSARQIMVETTGSYRRRLPESNDIDILVTSPPANRKKSNRQNAAGDPGTTLLHQLHARISQRPDFVAMITLGKIKYSFLFRFQWIVSIDIIYVPHISYFAALIYFTGSRLFNIWMREEFKKIGYSLDQYGVTTNDGKFIQLESEKHAFDILGIAYIAPQYRNNIPNAFT